MLRKEEAANLVPQEPGPDETGICRILVRLPRGQKLERRFHRTIHTLKVRHHLTSLQHFNIQFSICVFQDLYYFILAHPDSPYQFEMATSYPKRTLQWQPGMDNSPTLAELGLGASEALLVLDLDA